MLHIRRSLSTFRAALVVVLLVAPVARAADTFSVSSSYIGGGVSITLPSTYFPFYEWNYEAKVLFGGVEASDVKFVEWEQPGDECEPCPVSYLTLTCTVPPAEAAGMVDVVVMLLAKYPPYQDVTTQYLNAFTYYDAPSVSSISPVQHSIIEDDVTTTISGLGFSVQGDIGVYFGGRAASNISVDAKGQAITCLPPPFPQGSPFPLLVDVTVANPNGAIGLLTGRYSYNRVNPRLTGFNFPVAGAWLTGQRVTATAEHFVPGAAQIYFDGIPAMEPKIFLSGCCTLPVMSCVVPPHPPGPVSVTIVNGDGGVYTTPYGFYYAGTASTDFHTADVDHNFRFSLSEVLRVIQFYNAGGFHCDASSEDGYALGSGDQSCSPYASDHDPQDWQIGLSELLEVVQFYNLNCYQPCPDAPGTYCPPN